MAKVEIKMGEIGGSGGYFGSGTGTYNTWVDIDLGFAPKHIVLYLSYSGADTLVMNYDVENNKAYRAYKASIDNDMTSVWLDSSGANYALKVNGNIFSYRATESAMARPFYVMAF